MADSRLLKRGIIGAAVTALCCFTPILVILLTTVGLSAIIGYVDIVLLPALGIFILITLYALMKRKPA
ncbi:MAG: mercury resistance system transport protein MerF [Rhizobiaceae bacterium]|nr:mercury resistance system transport protein MerF [Rhizobiaceae bacterium]